MKAQHTPGPWSIDPEGSIAATIEGGNGEPICDVYGANKEADAHLIAAAPAMLESLQVMVNAISQINNSIEYVTPEVFSALEFARAVIIKTKATH
jgi:hypothetical protein